MATAAAAALYVTDRAGEYPIGCIGQACAHRLFAYTTNHHTQTWSSVYAIHLRNPCNYMDYYSFTGPEGMEG